MKRTKYELIELRDTKAGGVLHISVNLPMNTWLMLVRTKGNRLGFKRMGYNGKPRIETQVPEGQIQLL